MSSKYVVGIDEVGRGPLAGPVTLCAVRVEAGVYKKLKKNKSLPALGRDSKKLSKKDREKYSQVLKSLMSRTVLDTRFCFSIYGVSNIVIDTKGLSFAIKKALSVCLQKVGATEKDQILLDGGLKVSKEFNNQQTIIKGDEKHPVIAWASILAKVHRDNYMAKMAKKYPEYGFEKHVGYGTKMHKEAIKKHGPSQLHRKTFLN
ncbi:MAG: ribonuclease HII [Candidatus Zambryskibacteria bacterium]|nr:ribonuclease HII [Candidatus Zambryskibacteria bacterium]